MGRRRQLGPRRRVGVVVSYYFCLIIWLLFAPHNYSNLFSVQLTVEPFPRYDLTDDFIDDAAAPDDSDSENDQGQSDSSLKCDRCGKCYRKVPVLAREVA